MLLLRNGIGALALFACGIAAWGADAPAKPGAGAPARAAATGTQAQEARQPEPLEKFQLAQLRYLRSARDAKGVYAEVADPAGKVFQVRFGSAMGPNFGLVTRITPTRIVLKELVTQGDGEWEEEQAVLETALPSRPNPAADKALAAGAKAAAERDWKVALKHFDQARRLAKLDGSRDPRLALAWIGRGQVQEATGGDNFHHAADDYVAAWHVLRNGYRSDPQGLQRVHDLLVRLYRAHGYPEEYFKALEAGTPK